MQIKHTFQTGKIIESFKNLFDYKYGIISYVFNFEIVNIYHELRDYVLLCKSRKKIVCIINHKFYLIKSYCCYIFITVDLLMPKICYWLSPFDTIKSSNLT